MAAMMTKSFASTTVSARSVRVRANNLPVYPSPTPCSLALPTCQLLMPPHAWSYFACDPAGPLGLTSHLCPALQSTQIVARAAIEWYGPDRPKYLGECPLVHSLPSAMSDGHADRPRCTQPCILATA